MMLLIKIVSTLFVAQALKSQKPKYIIAKLSTKKYFRGMIAFLKFRQHY